MATSTSQEQLDRDFELAMHLQMTLQNPNGASDGTNGVQTNGESQTSYNVFEQVSFSNYSRDRSDGRVAGSAGSTGGLSVVRHHRYVVLIVTQGSSLQAQLGSPISDSSVEVSCLLVGPTYRR